MPELLLGCGNSRLKKHYTGDAKEWTELVTIDHDPNCGADIVHDLTHTPWPLADDSFDEVHAYEVLEHIGAQGDFRAFFDHFGEIWRILKPGGLLIGTVPAPGDIWVWADPSHTRHIAPETLLFLDQTVYADEVGKTAMTDFRWIWKGDLEALGIRQDNGRTLFMLKAHKPARAGGA